MEGSDSTQFHKEYVEFCNRCEQEEIFGNSKICDSCKSYTSKSICYKCKEPASSKGNAYNANLDANGLCFRCHTTKRCLHCGATVEINKEGIFPGSCDDCDSRDMGTTSTRAWSHD